MISHLTKLSNSWKTRWVANLDALLGQMESTRPRPLMANILNPEQKAILMQAEKLIKLTPMARMVDQLTTTLEKKKSVMSIVSDEKLQLAKRSAKEADQCVAVAFVLSAFLPTLRGYFYIFLVSRGSASGDVQIPR